MHLMYMCNDIPLCLTLIYNVSYTYGLFPWFMDMHESIRASKRINSSFRARSRECIRYANNLSP